MLWRCLVLVALAACNGGGMAACPSGRGLYCSTPATCMDDEHTVCQCDGATWTCSSCGDLDACTPSDSCLYWGFERDCSCACDEHGAWRCSSNDPRHVCPFGAVADAGADAP